MQLFRQFFVVCLNKWSGQCIQYIITNSSKPAPTPTFDVETRVKQVCRRRTESNGMDYSGRRDPPRVFRSASDGGRLGRTSVGRRGWNGYENGRHQRRECDTMSNVIAFRFNCDKVQEICRLVERRKCDFKRVRRVTDAENYTRHGSLKGSVMRLTRGVV